MFHYLGKSRTTLLECTCCFLWLAATANGVELTGVVQGVDAAARTITIERQAGGSVKAMKLDVAPQAEGLDRVTKGSSITVTFDPEAELVTSLRVTEMKAEQKEAIGDEDKDQVVLFNANDLEGWKFVVAPKFKDQAHLTVLDCWGVDADRAVLFSNGKGPTWLATEPNYDNFTLSLEWRFPPNTQPSPNGSGIVVRANGVHSFECDPRGIEIDISEANTGGFVCYGTPLNAKKKAAGETTQSLGRMADPDLKPSGQWNNMEIRCDGEKISVKVNGKSVNEGAGARVKKGEICLRSQSTAIEFRKIKLTPSKSESK